MRRAIVVLALLAALGSAAAQPARFIVPSLVFDDSAFNYAADAEGTLMLSRDAGKNLVTVMLVPGHVQEGLRFVNPAPVRASAVGVDRATARAIVGIDVSERGVVLPFDPAVVDPFEVLSYFHRRLPELGFRPNQELFGGNAYAYTCDCQQNVATGARVTIDRAGDRAYARLLLEIPTAY